MILLVIKVIVKKILKALKIVFCACYYAIKLFYLILKFIFFTIITQLVLFSLGAALIS